MGLFRSRLDESDAQSRWIAEMLPICPLCGSRARWEVYYRVSLISLFIVPLSCYQFVCSNCKAMWEAPCIHFFSSMPGEEVQLKLVRVGAGVRINGKLLNKKAPLRFWRQLATAKLP